MGWDIRLDKRVIATVLKRAKATLLPATRKKVPLPRRDLRRTHRSRANVSV